MGKGTSTTTQTTSPAGPAYQAYQDILARAQGVASTPYQAYGGDLTAPINAQQNLGISGINSGAGFAFPYIQQAAGYASDAARPISAQDIAQYQNPYTQQVVDATTAQFARQNAQQQESLRGRAIAQGALGGDRAKIAAADLGYQQQLGQAPVIAGLYGQGYNTALQTAQQQQQNRANAAYSLGNLGVSGQNAWLSGANAQVGAGNLQQQNEQARLNALYQQWQIAQAFPYQQTQWLAGVGTGVGSQMGGHSTTQGPQPNPWSQLLGLGLTGVGMASGLGWRPLAARGGRIAGFAPGGVVDQDFNPHAFAGSSAGVATQQPTSSGAVDPRGFGTSAGVGAQLPTTNAAGQQFQPTPGAPVLNPPHMADPGQQPGFGEPVPPTTAGTSGDMNSQAQQPMYPPEPPMAGFGGMGSQVSAPPTMGPSPSFAMGATAPQPGFSGYDPMVGGSNGTGPGSPTGAWQPFSAYNGRTQGFDAGGGVSEAPYAGVGWIPSRPITMGRGAPPPPQGGTSNRGIDLSKLVSAFPRTQRAAGIGPTNLDPFSTPAAGVGDVMPIGPSAAAGFGDGPIYWNGGAIRGYADGGSPDDDLSFSDRWSPTYGKADDSLNPRNWMGFETQTPAGERVGGTFDPLPAVAYADDRSPRVYRPDELSPLDEMAGVGQRPVRAPVRYAPDDDFAPPPPTPTAGVGPANDTRGGGWSNLSMPLMSAGLAMMASPAGGKGSFLRAVGEGGLAGVNTYAQQKEREQTHAEHETKLKMDARRLDQAAEQSRNALAERTREFDLRSKETERQHNMTRIPPGYRPTAEGALEPIPGGPQDPKNREQWKPTGQVTESGAPILMNPRNGQLLNTETGRPPDADTKIINPKRQAVLDDDTARSVAERYVTSGNRMVMTGYGRTGENMAKLAKAVKDMMAEKDITPEMMAHREAEWEGRKAGQRALGTAETRMALPAVESQQAIKLARGVIERVPRTSFLPMNRLVEGYQNQTLDPDQRELFARNQAVVNTYSAVMARGAAITTDSSRHRADELLQTAFDPKSYNRVLDTLEQEIAMAINAPQQVREIFRKHYGQGSVEAPVDAPWLGKPTGAGAATSAPVRVNTPDEARALKPGTEFIGPDGQIRIR